MVAQLRAQRRRMKIRQEVLAQRIGYSAHTISNVEQGKSSPKLDFLEAYAAGLGAAVCLVEGGSEEWQVTFQGEHYSQPQRYATEHTRADAMAAAADAVHVGHQDVRVRLRRYSGWVNVPREVAR